MWRTRLFWKIYVPYALLLILAAVAFVMIQSGYQEKIVLEQVRLRLHNTATIAREYLSNTLTQGPSAELQEQLRRLEQENETRITLVTDDGTVVGDSSEDPAVMNNHRDRDELVQARIEGVGESQRLSPTLKVPMMYFALRVGDAAKPTGFVRVAMRMVDVNAQIATVERLIYSAAVVGVLGALVLTYIAVGRIIRPLQMLTRAVKAVEHGDFGFTADVASRDEIGTLASAFNAMTRDLATRIRELQQSRQELTENTQLLQTVLGSMVEGVFVIGSKQEIAYVNSAAGHLLNVPVHSATGRPIWEVVREPHVLELLRKLFDQAGAQRIEFELIRTGRIVSLFASPLPGQPSPGAVLVLYDITELRRLERVRRDFVSNVSHELKTPLTAVRACAETLLDGALEDMEHNRRFVQQIDEQASRLEALIQDLMRLAKIESAQDVFEVQPVSLYSAVGQCLETRQSIAEAKGLTLVTQPPPNDIVVLADEEGLNTILDNLVDNAINYTGTNGRIAVRWTIEDDEARLDVIDTGIGVPLDQQERIFERFYRVDKARSRELGGTGLGLSIVKHLVNVFGGSVSVESEYGKGSTFTVRLPLAHSDILGTE